MEIKISVRAGVEYKGSKIVQTPCVIGRSKEVDLTIPHPSVSRQHCEIYEEAGQLYLRDNGSLNGTRLKGDFVETAAPIQPGDEFVIGELQLRIETTTDVDADTEIRVAVTEKTEPEMVTMIEPPLPPLSVDDDDDDDDLQLAPE